MVSHTVWTLFKPLMKATALSRRPNDRINERPATMIALVRATAVVLTLCIMYSCCCNVFFFFGTHTQNTHTHTPSVLACIKHLPITNVPSLLFVPCPSLPNKVMHLMKVECSFRCKLTITSCSPHPSYCLMMLQQFSVQCTSPQPFLPPFPISHPSHTLVCHLLLLLHIPNSTFHQLLVSPNDCHVEADN